MVGGHDGPDLAAFGGGNCVELGVQASFGSPDESSTPPFLPR